MIKCPKCGRNNILVFAKIPFVINKKGFGQFHICEPFGDFKHYPIHESATSMCNSYDCDWTGKLSEAIVEEKKEENASWWDGTE